MRINKSLIAFTPTSGGGSGSVTSVALSAPTGFVVTGSPITSSGTLALAFASGYSLPTTIKQSNWDDAYAFVTGFPVGTEGQLVKFDAFGDLLAFTPNFITNPMTSLGDMIYGNAVGLPLRLPPNTTTTKKYLSMTGDGTNGDTPIWDTITGFIGGSGTINYIPKFTASGTIGDSIIEEVSGSITVRGNTQLYKQQAGAGQTNLFIDNRDTTAAQTNTTILATQHLGSGQARTLIYAASYTAGNKNRGELGILTENGAQFVANIGTQMSGGENTFSLYSTSGIEGVRLNTGGTSWLMGGNVGINTNTPSEILSVNGNTHIVGVGSNLYFDTTGVTKTIRQFVSNNFEFNILNERGVTSQLVLGNQFITLGPYLTPQFYINTSNGNTGIGTTIPDSILQIVSSNSKGVIFGSSAGAVGTTQISTTAGASPVSSRLMFGTDGTGWQFRIAQNQAGTITDLVTVQTGGNVGINQTNPTEKLEVSGNVRISDALAIGTAPDTNLPFKILKNINSTVGIRFENTSTSSLAFSAIQFGTDVNGGTAFANLVYASSGITENGVYKPNGTALINTGSGGLNLFAVSQPIRFFTSTGTGTERFRIKNDGQVRFIPLASAPANAEAGDMYYNSTDNKHYGYNGTSWNALY